MGRGRAPCCEKVGLNKGAWTKEEDMRLAAYIKKYGHQNWRALPKQAGLLRCGKSCRLRWINYLRPDIKRGNFTRDEEATIIKLHRLLGNRWSKIASYLPGRTDNEIKNVWNTHLKKRTGPEDAMTNDDFYNKTNEKIKIVTKDAMPKDDFCNKTNEKIEIEPGSNPGSWGILEAPSSSSESLTATTYSECADFFLSDFIPTVDLELWDDVIPGAELGKRWLADLEKDLDLLGDSDPSVVMDGYDPVSSYFHSQPLSPWPLELLDLEL